MYKPNMDLNCRCPSGLILQIIILLDSTSYGLIYGFLAPYILGLGADQVVVGILAVGNLLCSLFSAHITNSFAQINGKRDTLYMIFSAAIVSHLMLAYTNSYWFTIIWRYSFSLTNQSQNLCKELLLKTAPANQKEYYLGNFAILNGVGFIIGPFIAGSLFDYGFGYVCILAATLAFVNTCLIRQVPIDKDETSPRQPETPTIAEKTRTNICNMIQDFKQADCDINWDLLAMRYLYLSSVLIFSTKFTQILKRNYQSSQFVIGYTSSYMNSLNFAGAYFIENLKNKYCSDIAVFKTIEFGFLLSGISLFVACYAPVYFLYALICCPIFFSFNFMNSSWVDFTMTRGNDSLNKLSRYIGIIAGLTVPLLFGLMHNVIGYHATVFFSTVPVFVSLLILKKYTCILFAEDADKVKQD